MLLVFVLLPSLAAGSEVFLHKGEGKACNESEGRWWTCKEEAACPLSEAQKRTLDVCSRKGWRRVVCCPPPQSAPPHPALAKLPKSERKCLLYGEFVNYTLPMGEEDGCTWGEPDSLIYGGQDADPGEFPHMVRLGLEDATRHGVEKVWHCGGSLISERFVLTAAHCLYAGKTRIMDLWAKVGDVVTTKEEDDPGRIIKVTEQHVPPSHRHERHYHDIALLKLAREVHLSYVVRPACLNRRPDPGTKFIAAGWGRTGDEFEKQWSAVLQKINLDLVPLAACAKIFKTSRNIPDGLNPAQICAGTVKGVDVCNGDSGGPLMVKLKDPYCTFSIVGIVSFGPEKCADGKPSVYTRVSDYVTWIENIVWSF